ncbi:polyprenyl synthetase superfamily [Verrucomicrobiia bacterium DG1235]|nr:polyprenyl synthetase superfamily [Verrucomicrobiae bacterium DG1235]
MNVNRKKPEAFTKESLKRYVNLPDGLESTLFEAASHALEAEGSFSRANIAIGAGEILDMDTSRAEAIGASIELFHLASLILDDLPCMDDASMRRSKECAHSVYGEGAAILAALGFINRAYSLLWDLFSEVGKEQQLEAADLVNDCLGFSGILDGQSRDIHFEDSAGLGAEVRQIASQKTGSLIRLCLLLPAILSSASRYDKMHLTRLAQYWGIAYQVADDLKDIYLGDAASGKTTRRDALLGRPNMALAIGEQAAARMLKDVIVDAERCLCQLPDPEWGGTSALDLFQEQLTSKAQPLIVAHCAA